MATLIKKVRVIDRAAKIDVCEDVFITPESIEIAPHNPNPDRVIEGKHLWLLPGLIDLHVHFREPGFTHKEDINSGIRAALCGGVTSALVMPNTYPAIDNYHAVWFQLQRAKKIGFDLMVAACGSRQLRGEQITDIAALKRAGAKAITDDGRPLFSDSLMENVLRACRTYDLLCMQHAENLCQTHGAPLHQGFISNANGLAGQPACAESKMVERDIALAQKIGARYHVLHISAAETLKLIKKAKKDGMNISAEVTPHHLMLSEFDLRGLNTRKKMNPPLRSKADRESLIDALNDGTIDAVASDHAPHTNKEKALPFSEAPFGVVGLETSMLVLLTLVKKGKLDLFRAIDAMTTAPAKILRESHRIGSMFLKDSLKNAVLIDPHYQSVFSERHLAGRSKNSPFIGTLLYGKIMATFLNGKIY